MFATKPVYPSFASADGTALFNFPAVTIAARSTSADLSIDPSSGTWLIRTKSPILIDEESFKRELPTSLQARPFASTRAEARTDVSYGDLRVVVSSDGEERLLAGRLELRFARRGTRALRLGIALLKGRGYLTFADAEVIAQEVVIRIRSGSQALHTEKSALNHALRQAGSSLRATTRAPRGSPKGVYLIDSVRVRNPDDNV